MNIEYKIGVINVLTIDDSEKLKEHAKIMESYCSNLVTTSFCIEDQYDGVYNRETHNNASIKVIELVEKIHKNFDGIVVSCTGDPGVEMLKQRINTPIIGAGLSVSNIALSFGKKVGVIGIRNEVNDTLTKCLGKNLYKYLKPDGIKNVNDLFCESGYNSVLKATVELECQDVDVIVLACTGISNLNIVNRLNEYSKLPIIDPVYAQAITINNICDFYNKFK